MTIGEVSDSLPIMYFSATKKTNDVITQFQLSKGLIGESFNYILTYNPRNGEVISFTSNY